MTDEQLLILMEMVVVDYAIEDYNSYMNTFNKFKSQYFDDYKTKGSKKADKYLFNRVNNINWVKSDYKPRFFADIKKMVEYHAQGKDYNPDPNEIRGIKVTQKEKKELSPEEKEANRNKYYKYGDLEKTTKPNRMHPGIIDAAQQKMRESVEPTDEELLNLVK